MQLHAIFIHTILLVHSFCFLPCCQPWKDFWSKNNTILRAKYMCWFLTQRWLTLP